MKSADGWLHYLETISRVEAYLPLDASTHVECTGYLEHGVDTALHPHIRRLAKICTPMKKTK